MKLHRFFAILMMIVLEASFFVACGDINGGVSGNSGDNGSGTKFTPDSLYINGVLTQGSENYKATNQIIIDSSKKMEEAGIPNVVIEKFNKWNEIRHEYILTTINDIYSSEVFNTTIEKEYAVLNLFMNSFYFVLMDAERTLKSLNGDLTGTMYKGKMVENLH